jgi:hypothetical protein
MRTWLDPRLGGPLLLAALCLLWRERAPRPAPPLAGGHSLALPVPNLPPHTRRNQTFELDAEHSTARFLVEGTAGELLVACRGLRGELRLGTDDAAASLTLHLDLGSLEPIGGQAPTIDLRRLLGVHRGSEIVYHGKLLSTSTTPVPGVQHLLWRGTLWFGSRAVQQPIGLWQCSLPGQPLRLQGHGTVATADYGLPRRTRFALFEEHHDVTLGLDLAWKRVGKR